MRARLTSLLLVTAGVAGVGCASKPLDELSAATAVDGGTVHAAADGAMGTSASAASLTRSPNAAGASGTAPGATAPPATSTRKASLSSDRGGNGATAPKVVSGSDNDIVARRLRKAAEQETNPALRAKLWKEYTDYRQGTSAK